MYIKGNLATKIKKQANSHSRRSSSCLLLRATDCNYQGLADKSEFSDFFIICPDKHFGELFVKILIRLHKEFLFLRNSTKCVMP